MLQAESCAILRAASFQEPISIKARIRFSEFVCKISAKLAVRSDWVTAIVLCEVRCIRKDRRNGREMTVLHFRLCVARIFAGGGGLGKWHVGYLLVSDDSVLG